MSDIFVGAFPAISEETYPFPLAWLKEITHHKQLDVCDAYLAAAAEVDQLYAPDEAKHILLQGTVDKFDENNSFTNYFASLDKERHLPALLADGTFDKYRPLMIDNGWLREVDASARLALVSAHLAGATSTPVAKVNELPQWPEITALADEIAKSVKVNARRRSKSGDVPPGQIKHEQNMQGRVAKLEITEWAKLRQQNNAILRPKNYLWNRWPAWLNVNHPGERLVLLAFDYLRTLEVSRTGASTLPTVTASIRQLRETARERMPKAVRAMLDNESGTIIEIFGAALKRLALVGAVQAVESASTGETLYRQDPRVFDKPPGGSGNVNGMAQGLGLDVDADASLLLLIRTMVRYGLVPIHQISELYQAIIKAAANNSAYRSFAVRKDARELAKHVETRTIRRFESLGKTHKDRVVRRYGFGAWLTDFEENRGREDEWRLSSDYRVTANDLCRAWLVGSKTQHDLRLPLRNIQRVAETCLLVTFNCTGTLGEDMAARTVAALTLIAYQQHPNGSIGVARLSPLRFLMGFPCEVPCSDLHESLDYAQPLRLLLVNDGTTTDDLTLTCRFAMSTKYSSI